MASKKKSSGSGPLVDRQRVSSRNAGQRKNLSKGALKASSQARERAKKYGTIVGGSVVNEQRTFTNDFNVVVSTPVKTKDGRRATIIERKKVVPSYPDKRSTIVQFKTRKPKAGKASSKK